MTDANDKSSLSPSVPPDPLAPPVVPNPFSPAPENKDRPRTRFQQPGGLPPIGSVRVGRPSQADDKVAEDEPSDDPIDDSIKAIKPAADPADKAIDQGSKDPPADSLAAPDSPPPRPFPPEVMLYAMHPQAFTDRLRALYDQSALNASLPTRWNLGVTLTIADAEMWDRVQAATVDSLHTLVPLTIRVNAVAPTVHDQQDYAVGWTVEPDSLDEIRRARASVVGSVQSIAADLALRPLDSAIPVAESVPALAFPTLIAAMQRDFTPFTWSIESFIFA